MFDRDLVQALIQESQEQLEATIDSISTSDSVVFRNHAFANNDQNAKLFGEALLRNFDESNIENLFITVQHLTETGDFSSLLRFIETTKSVETITLDGYGDYSPSHTASSVVVGRFLSAIARSSVANVELQGCRFQDNDLVEFLSNTSSRDVEIDSVCIMVPSRLAPSIQRNTSIRRLYLEITNRTLLSVLQILEGLHHNTTLQHLALEWSAETNMNAVLRSIERLLAANNSLRQLELQQFTFQTDSLFDLGHLQVLNLQSCRFDKLSTSSLAIKVKRAKNLHELALIHSKFEVSLSMEILESITKLRITRSLFTDALAKAIEASSLQSLSLFSFCDSSVDILVRHLPKFRNLRRLELESVDGSIMNVVKAIQSNTSLYLFEALPKNAVSTSEQRLIQYAMQRNKRLDAWASAFLCPFLFAEASPCYYGPDMIFKALMKHQH